MAQAAFGSLLRYLRRFHDRSTDPVTDGELLSRHIDGDETAFAALLRRHAPMVWGVCRRVLDNEQEAEDAFQASFLVLLRRADSLRVPQSLAAFLHGVAWRIARKARTAAQRRRRHEGQAQPPSPGDSCAVVEQRELRTLLDEELQRLPEKYRLPLVLCYLEGMSYTEAARQLGWRDGTLCGRLARARELLRKRLRRRGLTLSATALATTSTEPLCASTMIAAVKRLAALSALGEGAGGSMVSDPVAMLVQSAFHSMQMARLKSAVLMVMVLGLFAAGAGWTAHLALDEKPAETQPKVQLAPVVEAATSPPRDYYGDPLPPGALVRMGSVQLRHSGAHLAFAADGKTLISAGSDGTVRFWDATKGEQVRQTRIRVPKPPPRQPESGFAGLSPDGKLAAVFEEKSLILYDTRTGERVRRLSDAELGCPSLTFSANSKLLAALIYNADYTHALRVWDLSTYRERFHLEKLNRVHNTLVLSPNGSRLAYESYENEWVLHVLDTATGRELAKRPVEGWCFGFSPDDQILAAATDYNNDTEVTLWETAGLKKRATLRPARVTERSTERNCLAFSPDGKLLVLGGLEALVIWDVATGKERRRLDDRRAKHLVFSPDGKTLACAGEFEIRLWNIATGERLHARAGHDSWVDSMAVSPDGRVVASVAWDDPVVRLWDTATGKPLSLSPRHVSGIRSCAFTPDGRLLISGSYGVVRFLDAATGSEQRRFIVKDRKTGKQNQEILVSHLSADGKRLAVVSANQKLAQLTLWDVGTGEVLTQRSFNGWFSSFTPDALSVTVKGREQLTIEDTRTGQLVAAIPGDLGPPVAFSSDGQFLAVAMRKTQYGPPVENWKMLGVRVIEMVSRQELFHIDGSIGYTTFSPNGRRLVTAGVEDLSLWDVATGELLLRRPWPADAPRGPVAGPICSLAFLPTGRAVVAGMSDGTMLVWDMTPPLRKPDKAKDLSPKELNLLWSDLAGDARKAQRAISTLTASPKQALPFLSKQLHPVAPIDAKRVDRLLADLDSEQFAVRDAAARELEGMGTQIEPALRHLLESKPSLEVRNRVRAIQDNLHGVPPSATLRNLRAISALETLATDEARELLKKLAQGAAEARLTREAKASLDRLSRQQPARTP